MHSQDQNTKEIIEKILAIELEMFLNVPTAYKYGCQQYPDSFKLHRRAQFTSWSLPVLESYLHDLENIRNAGKNIMTMKYARMDNLVDVLNNNPLIDIITDQYCAWQYAMKAKYPGIINKGRSISSQEDTSFMTSFETYMRSELETYSNNTLRLLYEDMQKKIAQGISMTEEVYENLVQQLGYRSLEDAEKKAVSRK